MNLYLAVVGSLPGGPSNAGGATMYDQPQFEIRETARELAERNVVQVRQAYEQFMGLVTKAQ